MIDLEAIRAREAKATKGPWFTVGSPWLPSDLETYVIAGSPDPHIATAICEPIIADIFAGEDDADLDAQEATALAQSDADMDFIAHARTDIPALLAEVDRLREALQAMVSHFSMLPAEFTEPDSVIGRARAALNPKE